MLRVVADTNLYVSAAISPHGTSSRIIECAQRGEITLVMCGALCDEIQEVLARDKFRRWITVDEASEFVDAVVLLAEWVDDRPADEVPQVCDDPDDNFLIALYQDGNAELLVSGDDAVQRIEYPNVHIYSPAKALSAIAYRHEWGEGLVPGDFEAAWRHVEAEGSAALINVYSTFSSIVKEARDPAEAAELLGFVTVPSAVGPFVDGLEWLRAQLAVRGLATRPWFASPDVAYLKLPPDPGVRLRVTQPVQLPDDTIFATLQRCPDLTDPRGMGFDHWRVFGIGGAWPLEQIPPRPS